MDTVTYRAEQALLGALLTAGSSRAPGPVGAGDFGDSRHRALYAAITGTGPQPAGLLDRFRAWVAGLPWRRQIRDMRAYMAQLPGFCPDARHLEQYAAMVHQASGERGISAGGIREAGDLDRLAGAAAWLAGQTGQAAERPPSWPRRVQPAVAAAEQAVVPAMPGSSPEPSRQIASAPTGTVREAGPQRAQARVPAQRNAAPAVPRQVLSRGSRIERPALRVEDLQELILADLLRRPGDAKHVVGWLPAQAFTAGTRRATYDLIRSLIVDGKPADPVIVAWEARLARAGGGEPSDLPDPDEILRNGTLDPAPGSAAILGRALLADQLCTRRFGKDWPALPLLTKPVTASRDANRQPQSGQVPAPEPEPDTEPQPDGAPVAVTPPPAAPAIVNAVQPPPPPVPAAAGPAPSM